MIFSRNPEVLAKFGWALAFSSALGYGCARVEVQAPKEPIKMDISMRLDVYQHVVKDIDEIESIVSGKTPVQHAFASFLVQTAWASDLSPAIEEAALRRRDRKAQIDSLTARGAFSENAEGLLTVNDAAHADAAQAENADRMAIYKALAEKNGTSVEEIQKVYAEKLKKA